MTKDLRYTIDNKTSTDTKKELIRVLVIQYRKSSKMHKTQIFDRFIAVSEYRRKHAIHLLSGETDSNANQSNSYKISRSRRFCDEAVKEALIVLWEAADRICDKRPKAILPGLVNAMERHGNLNLDPDVGQSHCYG